MSDQSKETSGSINSISSDELKSFIERLEKLEEEKSTIGNYIRDVYGEAKSEGFDPKIMRKVLKIRSMKYEDVLEEEELLETYMQALKS
ncbi:MAG: DUF2312 domain-containing protein [Holosporales bacterium]|jgi:uncharacterized protein (UPF0335 family)|nr:DUF2312 domain-containing protein [Holosporales bacterium]